MERKSIEKNTNLLPSSLIHDLEYDEFDQEMQLKPLYEQKDSSSNSISYYFLFIIN